MDEERVKELLLEEITKDPKSSKELVDSYVKLEEIELKRIELENEKSKAIYESELDEQRRKDENKLSWAKIGAGIGTTVITILAAFGIVGTNVASQEKGINPNSLANKYAEWLIRAK